MSFGAITEYVLLQFILLSCVRIDKITDILCYSLEQSVRDDLAILRASPFIRKELAQESIGFVYNLKTGELSKVE